MADEPTPSEGFPDKGTRAKLYMRLDAQDTLLREIKTALVGDQFGNKGLVGRVEVAEKEINTVKGTVEKHDRKLWLAGLGLTAVWAGFLALKDELFK